MMEISLMLCSDVTLVRLSLLLYVCLFVSHLLPIIFYFVVIIFYDILFCFSFLLLFYCVHSVGVSFVPMANAFVHKAFDWLILPGSSWCIHLAS
jgi:hypothetical protein